MQQRPIGSLSVTTIGLGCNNFGSRLDATRSAAVINATLDAGINFLDTADIYGDGVSEEFIGQTLGARRAQVLIATKFGHARSVFGKGARPENVRACLEGSLKRLRTDYVDLYQLHQPDPTTPVADTLGALNDLVRAGKVREIGCSNFSVEQLLEAELAVRPGAARFVSVQNEYSLVKRDPEGGVLQECERQGLAFLPFFPLASGLLSGKYRKGKPAPERTRIAGGGSYGQLLTSGNLELVERLITYAESRGHTLLELAFSWLLAHLVVASVIAGASTPAQVQDNARAGGWTLTEEEMMDVDEILEGTLKGG